MAALAGSILGASASASAAEYTELPREAMVEVNGPMIVGRELVTMLPGPLGTSVPFEIRQIEYGGLTVGASPASSDTQRVNVMYVLERFDGARWVPDDWKLKILEVKGFDTKTAGTTTFTIDRGTRDLYRASYGITWTDAATGHTLSSGNVTASDGDSVCTTVFVECEATAGGHLRF